MVGARGDDMVMNNCAIENQGVVYFVDDDFVVDDAQIKAVIQTVAHQLGYEYQSIVSASQLFACGNLSRPGCLIVSDLALSQAEHSSGRLITDLQSYSSGGRLNLAGRGMATVVICQHPDVEKVVRLMRAGAVTVLPTPLDTESLTHWVIEAIEADRQRVREELRLEKISRVFNNLAQRKRCVLQHMIDGRASKWSAHDLDVSRRTIELDRAEILNAFGVNNAIELARLMTETKFLPLNYSQMPAKENSLLALAK